MNSSAVADRRLIDAIAADLGISAALVEKDWYVVQVLRTIAEHTGLGGHVPVFGGGTSLSKGFGVIKRLSEDIDFKVKLPPAASRNAGMKGFRTCRVAILDALRRQGFSWSDDSLLIGRDSAFFQVLLVYPRSFDMPSGFRPELKIELTFEPPRLATVRRPISSFIALGLGLDPEIAEMDCVDPLEIAADKVSAFTWRSKKMLDHATQEGVKKRDGTLVRHLHDLAALESLIRAAPDFAADVQVLMKKDIARARVVGADPASIIAEIQASLESAPIWRQEYEAFIRHLSYASDEERISYDAALACWTGMTRQILDAIRIRSAADSEE